jgi:hypothetical protein
MWWQRGFLFVDSMQTGWHEIDGAQHCDITLLTINDL